MDSLTYCGQQLIPDGPVTRLHSLLRPSAHTQYTDLISSPLPNHRPIMTIAANSSYQMSCHCTLTALACGAHTQRAFVISAVAVAIAIVLISRTQQYSLQSMQPTVRGYYMDIGLFVMHGQKDVRIVCRCDARAICPIAVSV
eukprot:scaffold3388_cov62-Attheya_sp.AAC.3